MDGGAWWAAPAAAAKSLQSCLTLCDPKDGCLPGSPIPGILQARTLEWVAVSFSNAWKWKVKVKWLSYVWLLATPWTAAYQAPPSMGFSRQEYWSGVPLPSLRICATEHKTYYHAIIFSYSTSGCINILQVHYYNISSFLKNKFCYVPEITGNVQSYLKEK